MLVLGAELVLLWVLDAAESTESYTDSVSWLQKSERMQRSLIAGSLHHLLHREMDVAAIDVNMGCPKEYSTKVRSDRSASVCSLQSD